MVRPAEYQIEGFATPCRARRVQGAMEQVMNAKAETLRAWDWNELHATLVRQGYAVTPRALSAAECEEVIALYDEPDRWRARIDMARHRFGSGEYKYFAHPLPDVVADLRTAFYPWLAPIANGWQDQLGLADRFPEDLDAFLERCHAAGQTRPTPLVLRYGAGDYNCLHPDIYGE